MTRPLHDKRAIVTGAASGIGLAVFCAFRSEGARVIGIDIAQANNGGECLVADVSCEAEVEEAVGIAAHRLGGIDILVNCAGIYSEAPLGNLDMTAFDQMFAVNVRGTALAAKAVLRHMPEGGRIINVASELAYLGRANASGYSATKGAILSMTRSWARELAPRILVNAVAPGPTDTPLLRFDELTPDLQAIELDNPLRRIGRPEEVAAAIVFLAGPGATFMTGQCIAADGGAAMR